MIDLIPFTRIIWKSYEIRKKWESRLSKISGLQHQAEYEMVRKRKRKAATLHLDALNFEDKLERLMKDKLIFLPILRSKKYSGFSHKHFPTAKSDPDSFVYGVLARDYKTALKFKEASSSGKTQSNHKIIGKLLGYPKCCCDFFDIVWSKKHIVDPLFECAENTPTKKLINNNEIEVYGSIFAHQYLRYFGPRITTHFPCSLICKETIKIGKEWLKIMREIDNKASNWLIEILSKALTWNAYKGIAQIDHPYFYGIVNSIPTLERKIVHYYPLYGEFK